jgi:predicted glycosyltransferase
MTSDSTYNILMYSHDTYGLGHIRRTMAIASHLRGENINILILTGSPIAGRFIFPGQVDFVRIPGMIKMTNEEYQPLSIKIRPEQALNIRKSIINATARTFRPDLFIVDKEPLGLKKEILSTLQWIRRELPECRTILGLRDVMDDAEVVCRDWRKRGIYEALDTLYDAIWVYGVQAFYDSVREYEIPAAVSRKVHFTGYIPRKIPSPGVVRNVRKRYLSQADQKLVVVTTGGGGDGYTVMNIFLSMLEKQEEITFKSILITGPFMARQDRKSIRQRARRLGVTVYDFYNRMEELLAAADLVVSMGGYNTICEILSQGTLTLVIPRQTPRREQLIRAQVLQRQNLLDYISWDSVSPEKMQQKIFQLLSYPARYHEAISNFKLTGLDTMRCYLRQFRSKM